MCMDVLLTHVSLHLVHAWYPRRSEEDIRFPGSYRVIIDHVDAGNQTSGPLAKQQVLLEPSLQTRIRGSLINILGTL